MKPLFVWAGGKGKMLKHYESIPQPEYSTYVEPFLGGGAMFIKYGTADSILNDSNEEIMGIYDAIKNDADGFIEACDKYIDMYFAAADRKSFYYSLRTSYWSKQSPALLYVLMRLGFNGIWQTCKDSKGLFGTPAGLLRHQRKDQILDTANVYQWEDRLSEATLLSKDFEDVGVGENSFIFLDPPYRGSFTSYGKTSDDDFQMRVIRYAQEGADAGHTVWLANRDVGDGFFDSFPGEKYFFDVTYTAGRRKVVDNGFEAKKAREFVWIPQDCH